MQELDHQLLRKIYSIDNQYLIHAMTFSDLFYYPEIFATIGLGSYSLLFDPTFIPGSQNVFLSYLISFGVERILKRIVSRKRPYQQLKGIKQLESSNLGSFHQETSSFPSGHSVGMFAIGTALTIQILKNDNLSKIKKGILIGLIYIIAGLIALNRSRTGMHYPIDITVGAITGIIIAILVSKIQTPIEWPSKLVNKFI